MSGRTLELALAALVFALAFPVLVFRCISQTIPNRCAEEAPVSPRAGIGLYAEEFAFCQAIEAYEALIDSTCGGKV